MKNKSCSATWVDQKNVFEPKRNPKNNPLGPKNGKNDPKIRSNSNVRIEGIIENKSCSTTWLDPKQFLNLLSTVKIAKVKIKSQNWKLRVKIEWHIEKENYGIYQ